MTTVVSAADPPKDAKLREILARQKGDQLQVYLRNATSTFVNGKTISLKELPAIIKQSGVKKALITAEPLVSMKRVTEVRQVVLNAGVKEIHTAVVKQTGGKEQTIVKVLTRQKKKGDELGVYLRDSRRVYVNGTQISLKILSTVVGRSRAKSAVVTAEPFVSKERNEQIRKLIQEAGIKEVALAIRKHTPGDDNVVKILTRQKKKGDSLGVYLKGSRIYINGTQISLKTLATVVGRSGAKQAVISAEASVTAARVKDVTQSIQKAGLAAISIKKLKK